MRGVSGSGKSTKARELCEGYGSVVCSADEYFMADGEYKFDPAKLGQAHAWCQGRFSAALEANVDVVVVDNTNTRRWEYERYVKLAEKAGYEVELVKVGSLDEESLKLYADRNRHGVGPDIIQKQAERFEE